MSTKAELKAQAIKACADKNGKIEPAAVVKAARHPKSPLFGEFIWNEKEAAMEHWLETARRLIREVKFQVTYEQRVLAAPYYVRDQSSETGYTETLRIAKRGGEAKRIMKDEMARIQGALGRALALAAQFGLTDQLERMVADAVVITGLLNEDA